MSYLLAFLLSAALSTALIPLLVQVAGPLGLLDYPDERKVHAQPVPRVGGIAIGLGVLVPVLLWVPLQREILAYLVGGLIVFAMGLLDDRHTLGYREKFAGQLAGALIVVLWGGVVIHHPPFCGALLMPGCADGVWSPFIAVPVTVLAIVGVTNAINLADGLDGLAGGTMLLTIGTVGILAFGGDDAPVPVAHVAIIVSGALLGFLRYNTYPARVFMGDAGSQLLGYSAAVLVIVATQVDNPVVSPALPLLLLALPIADTLAVMVQRISEGRSPFSPDRNHVHHRLIALGLTHHEAVIVIYAVQVAIVVATYVLRYQSDAAVTAVGLFFGLGPVVALYLAGARGWRFGGKAGQGTGLARVLARYRGRALPAQAGLWVLRVSVPAALGIGGLLAAGLSPDVGLVAAAAFVALLVGLQRRIPDYLLSLGVYVTAALVAYALETSPAIDGPLAWLVNVLLALLALGILLLLRFEPGRGTFRVNPLDFLIVLLTLLVPPVLRELNPEVAVGGFMLKFIVIAYAGEILLTHGQTDRRCVAAGALGGTFLLTLQAFL
jgi:UDP-GlcNAc:undecaprenyl-phosphate GlcNAc-1-phosphate transferase